jgi:hypothetical protein
MSTPAKPQGWQALEGNLDERTDLDNTEFPQGSQKRQNEVWRLEALDAANAAPVSQDSPPEPGKVPEEVWRGNG